MRRPLRRTGRHSAIPKSVLRNALHGRRYQGCRIPSDTAQPRRFSRIQVLPHRPSAWSVPPFTFVCKTSRFLGIHPPRWASVSTQVGIHESEADPRRSRGFTLPAGRVGRESGRGGESVRRTFHTATPTARPLPSLRSTLPAGRVKLWLLCESPSPADVELPVVLDLHRLARSPRPAATVMRASRPRRTGPAHTGRSQ